MFKAIVNCWRIPELRHRIIVTLALLFICRVIANVPCPGVDLPKLEAVMNEIGSKSGAGDVLNLFNMFTGGALQKFAVGSLGIMPYITASIIMQLMTPIFPQLERLKREGEPGFQKINQLTRYITLAICLIQGTVAALAMEDPSRLGLNTGGVSVVAYRGPMFIIMSVIILTCGTLILMWLGEQITEHGVGQGASLIITIGIINGVPAALASLKALVLGGVDNAAQFSIVYVVILLVLFVLVTAATVGLTVAVRKVPIQYARMMAGRPAGPAQASFFPLAVNFANVMPIIFASALMMLPGLVLSYLAQRGVAFASTAVAWFQYGSATYVTCEAILILVFTFFWVASQFNPIQIADELKRQGAYVPGVRPGKPTAEYLDWTMTRITTFGALYLVALAVLPVIFNNQLGVPQMVAHFFGGTSLLIIVGVLLNTMRQIESMLMTHGYDSFMHRGRLRGRGGRGN